MTSCPPVRVQMLAEVAPLDTEAWADAIMFLVGRAGEALHECTGLDLSDPMETDVEWGTGASHGDWWSSNRRHKRTTNLERFERAVRTRGPRAVGGFTWSAGTAAELPYRFNLDFTWWSDVRPQFLLTALWDATAPTVQAPSVERAMVRLAADAVAELNPVFLQLTDDVNHNGPAALDAAQGRGPSYRRVEPGQLRSYAWVTHLTDVQVATCGGVEGLMASGAFHTVVDVSQGVLCQATERFADYVGSRVRKVREALGPVLPAVPMIHANPDVRLAWDDGSDGPMKPPVGNMTLWASRRS